MFFFSSSNVFHLCMLLTNWEYTILEKWANWENSSENCVLCTNLTHSHSNAWKWQWKELNRWTTIIFCSIKLLSKLQAEEEKQGHRYLGRILSRVLYFLVFTIFHFVCTFICFIFVLVPFLSLSLAIWFPFVRYIQHINAMTKGNPFTLFCFVWPIASDIISFACAIFMGIWFGVSIIFAIDIISIAAHLYGNKFKHSIQICINLRFSMYSFHMNAMFKCETISEEPTIQCTIHLALHIYLSIRHKISFLHALTWIAPCFLFFSFRFRFCNRQ